MLIAMIALASIAYATTQMNSAGPLTRILITDQLNCGVSHVGDSAPEFYGDTACGTFLVVGAGTPGSVLFGPQNVPAGGAANPRTPWTQVSQSAVTGSGTAADPFKIVTIADAGTTGIRITETDTYIVGQEAYRTDVTISNRGTTSQDLILYRAGDCYLGNDDAGFGRYDAATGAIACTKDATPSTRIEQWFPLTPGSRYYEAFYSTVWQAIGSRQPFPSTCECSIFQDNGGGLSWSLTSPAGTSLTVSHFTTFSPIGIVPLSASKTADAASVSAGSVDGYTITVTNPNATAVSLNSVSDTLPAGFSYVSGSTTGVTTANPTGTSTLSWSGPFSVPGNGSISLHFNVTVSTVAGIYLNNATADGGNVPVAATGPTAPITVTPSRTGNFSLAVDGSTGYAEAPDAPKLNPTSWTVEAWFKDQTPGGYNHPFQKIVAKADETASSEAPYYLIIGNNELRAGIQHNYEYKFASFSLAATTANAWHHAAATLDASSNTVTLYLDGVQVAQTALLELSSGNTVPVSIGRGGNAGYYFNGKIDDVRIWNVVRTGAQIAANTGIELTGPQPGLMGNWKFNEGSGTTAVDSTPAPANATLNGGASFSTDVPHP